MGERVQLDGSASYSLSGISTYHWVEVPVSTVTLNMPTSAAPDFIAPSFDTKLTFELTIMDNNGISAKDKVEVLVGNPQAAKDRGGGCSLVRGTKAGFDPLFPFLVLIALLYLFLRKNSCVER